MALSETDERILREAEYMIESNGTVRSTAKKFGVSKTTVHKDLSQKLYYIDQRLFKDVEALLKTNLAERHIRGGNATKKKYLELHNARKMNEEA